MLELEPPSPDRHEEAFSAAVLARFLPETASGFDALLRPPAPGGTENDGENGRDPPALLALGADTGSAHLQSVDEG